MKLMRRHVRVQKLGWSALLLLIACGRPDSGSTSSVQVGVTAIAAATSVPAPVTHTPTIEPTSVPVQTPSVEETTLPAQHTALIERAREQGTVRIIVTLGVPWKPEGELPDEAAITAQRKAIADAQAALTKRLESFNVSDITAFQFIPSMAMAVDVPALELIIADPMVQSIQEDALASPSLDAPAAPSLDAPN